MSARAFPAPNPKRRAPRSGTVLNLAVTTLRAVVEPGVPIKEIVPASAAMIARLKIRANARDAIRLDMPVTARLQLTRSRDTPVMPNRLVDVSGNLKTKRDTGLSHYEARLLLKKPPELRRLITQKPLCSST